MKTFPFLDDERDEDQNLFLMSVTRAAIVTSAVSEGLIEDADLATVPELWPPLIALVAELRDDLYEHHQKTRQQIQFPLVRNCCCYAFAKGAEAAWLWHQSSNGKVKLRHSSKDALKGAAGAKVPGEYAAAITAGMQLSAEVFCDFQNRVLLDESLDFAQGDRWLADGFARAFFWFGQVGLDFGMKRLGYP